MGLISILLRQGKTLKSYLVQAAALLGQISFSGFFFKMSPAFLFLQKCAFKQNFLFCLYFDKTFFRFRKIWLFQKKLWPAFKKFGSSIQSFCFAFLLYFFSDLKFCCLSSLFDSRFLRLPYELSIFDAAFCSFRILTQLFCCIRIRLLSSIVHL